MRQIVDMLEELSYRARREAEVKERLLQTKQEKDPLFAFCKACQDLGYEIYPMELVSAGEEFHAAMKRSTNGGGENTPKLSYNDDFYELFFAGIEE